MDLPRQYTIQTIATRVVCADTIKPAGFTVLNWKMIEPTKQGEIFWHLVNFTPDQPKHKTILAFTEAFRVWQEAFDRVPPVGRYIKLKSTSDFHKAHVKIVFMDPKVRQQSFPIEDGSTYTFTNKWPFSGPLDVLAHRPHNLHELHFDESEQWSDIHKWERVGDKWRLYVDLMSVVIHELGHIWGLNHSKVKAASMYEAYSGIRRGLHPDDQEGLNYLWAPIKKRIHSLMPAGQVVGDSHDLMCEALKFYGLKEVPGGDSNPVILNWIQKYIPRADDDSTTAWCAISANEICKLAGYEHTNSAMAKNFLKIGEPVEWEDRQFGDCVILNRGSDPRFGHVNFYVNDRRYGGREGYRGIGGNQQDAWNIRTYPRSRIAGIRRLKKIAHVA